MGALRRAISGWEMNQETLGKVWKTPEDSVSRVDPPGTTGLRELVRDPCITHNDMEVGNLSTLDVGFVGN